MHWSRREFFRAGAVPAVGACVSAANLPAATAERTTAKPSTSRPIIGLSQSSLQRTIQAGDLDLLDYPAFVRDAFGIQEIEIDLAGAAMPTASGRNRLLMNLSNRSAAAGTSVFLMSAGTVRLATGDIAERTAEEKRFHQLVDQTCMVGARSIRVRLDSGHGSPDVQALRATAGLKRLVEHADARQINLLIEPGVGASRNRMWLAQVIRSVDHPRCGSLPGLGKFGKDDHNAGMTALLTAAHVLSAQSRAFTEDGLELQCDYPKWFKRIVDAGFHGIIAIAYQGDQPSEIAGIKATQRLIHRLLEILSA